MTTLNADEGAWLMSLPDEPVVELPPVVVTATPIARPPWLLLGALVWLLLAARDSRS